MWWCGYVLLVASRPRTVFGKRGDSNLRWLVGNSPKSNNSTHDYLAQAIFEIRMADWEYKWTRWSPSGAALSIKGFSVQISLRNVLPGTHTVVLSPALRLPAVYLCHQDDIVSLDLTPYSTCLRHLGGSHEYISPRRFLKISPSFHSETSPLDSKNVSSHFLHLRYRRCCCNCLSQRRVSLGHICQQVCSTLSIVSSSYWRAWPQ